MLCSTITPYISRHERKRTTTAHEGKATRNSGKHNASHKPTTDEQNKPTTRHERKPITISIYIYTIAHARQASTRHKRVILRGKCATLTRTQYIHIYNTYRPRSLRPSAFRPRPPARAIYNIYYGGILKCVIRARHTHAPAR